MELGKEKCFLDLITGVIAPSLRQRLLRHEPRSALDIGCGIGTTLVCLHYALGLDILEGLDLQSEGAVLEAYNKDARKESRKEIASVPDAWLEVTCDPTDVRPRITEGAQMRELLNISYASPIGTYEFMRENYDLIILSNVLHYLYPHMIGHAFRKVRELSHERTLIYIRVKDGFEGSKVSSDDLLRYCRTFAEERGLIEYEGGRSKQGAAFTFTNI